MDPIDENKILLVRYLSNQITEEIIDEIFSHAGKIVQIMQINNGVCVIRYEDAEAVKSAKLMFHGLSLCNQKISLIEKGEIEDRRKQMKEIHELNMRPCSSQRDSRNGLTPESRSYSDPRRYERDFSPDDGRELRMRQRSSQWDNRDTSPPGCHSYSESRGYNRDFRPERDPEFVRSCRQQHEDQSPARDYYQSSDYRVNSRNAHSWNDRQSPAASLSESDNRHRRHDSSLTPKSFSSTRRDGTSGTSLNFRNPYERQDNSSSTELVSVDYDRSYGSKSASSYRRHDSGDTKREGITVTVENFRSERRDNTGYTRYHGEYGHDDRAYLSHQNQASRRSSESDRDRSSRFSHHYSHDPRREYRHSHAERDRTRMQERERNQHVHMDERDRYSDHDRYSDRDHYSNRDRYSNRDHYSDCDHHSDRDRYSNRDRYSDHDRYSDRDHYSDRDRYSDREDRHSHYRRRHHQ